MMSPEQANLPIKGIRIRTFIQVNEQVDEYITQLVTDSPGEKDTISTIKGHCQTILNTLDLEVNKDTNKVKVPNARSSNN
jgi:hypothetical protein